MLIEQEKGALVHGHSDLTQQLDELDCYLVAMQRAPQELELLRPELLRILELFQADYRGHITHEECEIFPLIEALGPVWSHQVESMRQEHFAIDVSASLICEQVKALDDGPLLVRRLVALRSESYLLRQIFRRHIRSERDCLTSAQAIIGQMPLF